MQFRLVEEYHRLLIEGIEWQASSVMHHARNPRAVAPFVRIVEQIREAGLQPSGLLLTEIDDEDLEIAADAMEEYYDHCKHTFWVNHEGCVNLIEMLQHAEDICLLAVGRKPPERTTYVRSAEIVA